MNRWPVATDTRTIPAGISVTISNPTPAPWKIQLKAVDSAIKIRSPEAVEAEPKEVPPWKAELETRRSRSGSVTSSTEVVTSSAGVVTSSGQLDDVIPTPGEIIRNLRNPTAPAILLRNGLQPSGLPLFISIIDYYYL